MASLPVDASFDAGEEASLWEAMASAADAGARGRLIEIHLPYARILAARMYANRRHDEVEFDDFMQLATVGLIESVDRFDPRHGAAFRTFASHRIHGAILNGLETFTEKQQQIACRQRVARERVRSLDDEADQEEDLFERLARVAVGLALGYLLEGSGMYRESEQAMPDTVYRSIELRQLQQRVRALVEELPERERRIVRYHYFQHVPFETIAQMMGVTKGRVSQLHRRAMQMLRDETRKVRRCDIAW